MFFYLNYKELMDTNKVMTTEASKFVTWICCRCRWLCWGSCSCWFWRGEDKNIAVWGLKYHSIQCIPPTRRKFWSHPIGYLSGKSSSKLLICIYYCMSRDWTKLHCKPTLVSVIEGPLRLSFSFNISLFLIYRCNGWPEMHLFNSAPA